MFFSQRLVYGTTIPINIDEASSLRSQQDLFSLPLCFSLPPSLFLSPCLQSHPIQPRQAGSLGLLTGHRPMSCMYPIPNFCQNGTVLMALSYSSGTKILPHESVSSSPLLQQISCSQSRILGHALDKVDSLKQSTKTVQKQPRSF